MRPIEFVARVAELTGSSSNEDTEKHVRAVFATLTEAVTTGEIVDIAEELGHEYADLLGRRPVADDLATSSATRGLAERSATARDTRSSPSSAARSTLAIRPVATVARVASRPILQLSPFEPCPR